MNEPLPPSSMAHYERFAGAGIRMGDLFAFYGADRRGPDVARLVRFRTNPDNPKMFDLVAEDSGDVVATYGWASRVWTVGFLAPGQPEDRFLVGWKAPMPIAEVERLAILEHREAQR